MGNVYTPLFTDTFQRANENPLSDGGKWSTVTHALEVSSDLCGPASGSVCGAYLAGVSLPANQYAEATISSTDITQANTWRILLRGTSLSQTNGYMCNFAGNNDGTANFAIRRNNTNIVTSSNVTINSGDVIHFEVFGTAIAVWQNGVVLLSATDGSIASGGALIEAQYGSDLTDTAISLFVAGSITQGSQGGQGNSSLGNVIFDLDSEGFPIAELQTGTNS